MNNSEKKKHTNKLLLRLWTAISVSSLYIISCVAYYNYDFVLSNQEFENILKEHPNAISSRDAKRYTNYKKDYTYPQRYSYYVSSSIPDNEKILISVEIGRGISRLEDRYIKKHVAEYLKLWLAIVIGLYIIFWLAAWVLYWED